MEREFRNRPSGIIFYLSLVVMLLLSDSGRCLIKSIQFDSDISNAFGVIIGAGILLFTSDGVGFIFSSIVYALFNWWGGYSRLFQEKLAYGDFRADILELYSKEKENTGHIRSEKFNQQLEKISVEALFVYFFWYREKHENPLDDWHIRRYTVFFTGYSVIVAILISQIIAIILIVVLNYGCSWYNTLCVFLLSLIVFALVRNSNDAMKNALHALDLWTAGATNPKFRNVLEKVHPLSSNE